MRLSNHSFLFYASGRRFCSVLKATLEMRRRQDLFAQLWYRISGRPDFVELEVAMNEGAMPPMVSGSLLAGVKFVWVCKVRLGKRQALQGCPDLWS